MWSSSSSISAVRPRRRMSRKRVGDVVDEPVDERSPTDASASAASVAGLEDRHGRTASRRLSHGDDAAGRRDEVDLRDSASGPRRGSGSIATSDAEHVRCHDLREAGGARARRHRSAASASMTSGSTRTEDSQELVAGRIDEIEPAHGHSARGVTSVAVGAVRRLRPTRPRPRGWWRCSSSQRCASSAAMVPEPAAVTAWRYVWSWTSPAAKTPGMFVRVERGSVTRYPASSWSSQSRKSAVFGSCPTATNRPSASISRQSRPSPYRAAGDRSRARFLRRAPRRPRRSGRTRPSRSRARGRP